MGFAWVFDVLFGMLLPSRCPCCGTAGPAPCPACWSRLQRAPFVPAPAGVDRIRSLVRYDDVGRDLVVRLKYANARAVVAWLAAGMAALVHPPPGGFGAITWAPTSRRRRHERGFDQAEVLARAVGRALAPTCTAGRHPPVGPLLTRLPGPAQTGRTRRERHAGPPAFMACRPPPSDVLLVDDVFTTGVTVSAAAVALKRAGATTVHVVTAACTPLKVWEPSADP